MIKYIWKVDSESNISEASRTASHLSVFKKQVAIVNITKE